jgi:general secretion pathway protein D
MKFHDGQFTASNGASGKLMFRPRRILALLMVLLTLHGCAADRLHSQGLELMDEGKVVEGVAKLNEAVKKDPDNLSFRNDLIRRRDQAVQRMLMSADNERSVGHLAAAGLIYQRVLVIDSENPRAKAGLENIQRDERHTALLVQIQALFDKHDLDSAQNLLRTVLLENPDQREAKQLQRKIDEQVAKDAMAGPMLKPEFRKPVTLQFRDANLRMVIEALSRSNGINIILDKDVKNDLKTTIFVKDASVEDTIDLVLLQNQLEKKILSDNTILIYPSNPAKIKEYQDLMIRTFHLTNSDAKQMLTMIKTMLKTKDLYVDEKTNSLVMRDTPDAVRLAEKLIAAQDLAEPEVLLEVEVLEITRSRLTLTVRCPRRRSPPRPAAAWSRPARRLSR